MRAGSMFPPQTEDKYHVLAEEELVAGVTQYVSKNQQLPKIFKACDDNLEDDDGKLHQDNLTQLLDAVNKPDYRADIFRHPLCGEYVIYLMQKKRISFHLGLDVYVYLMSLGQFTELRNIKPEDMDVKSIRAVGILPLITDNQLTEFGAEYLKNMVVDFKEYGIDLDIAEMQMMLLELPPFSQALIQIGMTSVDDAKNADVSKGFYNSRANCPFFVDSHEDKFNLPMSNLRNYFYSKMNAKPVQEKAMLGSVGEKTLFDLHEKGQHPSPLYSHVVKMNIKSVHGRNRGMVPVLLHDITHVFGPNLLKYEERRFILEGLIPAFRAIKNKDNNPILNTLIDKLTFELTDFFFAYIRFYLNPKTRLQTYLDKVFERLRGVYGEMLIEAANDNSQMVKHLTNDDVKKLVNTLKMVMGSDVFKKYGFDPAIIKKQIEKINDLVSLHQDTTLKYKK